MHRPTTPERLAAARDALHSALRAASQDEPDFPIVLATMRMHLVDDRAQARAMLDTLSAMMKRDPVALADQVLVGPAEACAAELAEYADAGVDTVFVWPLGDPVRQLRHVGGQVVPQLR